MFDSHSHPGKESSVSLVCTTTPEEVLKLDKNKYKYLSVGMLPEGGSENISLFKELVDSGLYIGEIGLDKRFPNIEKQLYLLKEALKYAKEKNVFFTLHQVGYIDKMLSLLSTFSPLPHFLVHSFTGSIESARRYISLKGIISLSPKVEKTKYFSTLLESLPYFTLESDMPTGNKEEKTLRDWEEKLTLYKEKIISIEEFL